MKPTTAKTTLTPKLHFREFRDAPGWAEKSLKEAALINPSNNGIPESFVYIDLESVDAGELKAKTRISRVGAPSRAQRLIERGDIIYQVVRGASQAPQGGSCPPCAKGLSVHGGVRRGASSGHRAG